MIKWDKIKISESTCQIFLENGESYVGSLQDYYWHFGRLHHDVCKKLFINDLKSISKVLEYKVTGGSCPEYKNPKKFIQDYFEKIGSKHGSLLNSDPSKLEKVIVVIEDDFDIKPKFKL